MKLSIIIPFYNEEKTLKKIISAVEAVVLPLEKEIIFVDDGSSDRSREILNQLIHAPTPHQSNPLSHNPPAGEGGRIDAGQAPQVGYPQVERKVIFLDKNQGKGAAVKRGFQEATGDIVLIQDADLEYDPQDYPALIKPIIDGKTDVVYGSRFLGPELNNTIVYKHGYIFSRFLNWLSNILSGVKLTDMYVCYKVFSRKAAGQIWPKLKSKRFGIDPELTAWVGKLNLKIIEVPISYKGRTYEEGKKINWKDGLAAVWHIFRFNIFARK